MHPPEDYEDDQYGDIHIDGDEPDHVVDLHAAEAEANHENAAGPEVNAPIDPEEIEEEDPEKKRKWEIFDQKLKQMFMRYSGRDRQRMIQTINRPHPAGRIIKDVAVHYQRNECLLPILMSLRDRNLVEYDHDFVYCTYCNSFIKIRSNITNLEKHYKTSKHSTVHSTDSNYTQRMMSDEISTTMKKAILFHHLPISLVDSKILSETITLPCRQTFTRHIKDYAAKTRQRIKELINNANNFTVTFDGFKSRSKRRYIGVDLSFLCVRGFMHVTLAHREVLELHETSDFIGNLLLEVLNEYNLIGKLDYAVADGGTNMIGGIESLNLLLIMDGTKEIEYRLCCCHCLNTIVGCAIDKLSPYLTELQAIQASLGRSSTFSSFCSMHNLSLITIPGIYEVRWNSIYEMISHLYRLQPAIISFLEQERKPPVQNNHWTTIEDLMGFFYQLKLSYEKMESGKFGTIGYVVCCFANVRDAMNKLRDEYNQAKAAFNDKYKSYWTDDAETKWYPLIHIACRLNPNINHASLLADKLPSIDAIIEEKLKEIWDRNHPQEPNQEQAQPQAEQRLPVQQTQGRQHQPVQQPRVIQQPHAPELQLRDLPDFGSQSAYLRVPPKDYQAEFNDYKLLVSVPNDDVDLKEFWTNQFSRWPTLTTLAREILSIIPTSAGTERQFSIMSDIEKPRRNKMKGALCDELAVISCNPSISEEFIK